MIDLLNRYFVSVYSANEDMEAGGLASPREKAERQRIYSTYINQKRDVGDVHVYILTPDAQPLDGIKVGDAIVGDAFLNVLKRVIQKQSLKPGGLVIPVTAQSAAPAAPADSLVLHVSSRGEVQGTDYRRFPAENWIVLSQPEWSKLLPAGPVKADDAWVLPPDLATKLLNRFYPQTEEINSRAERGRIDRQQLKLTVSSIKPGLARARIEGNLRMRVGSLRTNNEDWFVDAELTGFLEFDPSTRRIQRLRLVTKKASYKGEQFLAALRSVFPGTQ